MLPVLCELVPPTAGNTAFKECSDVTTVVLQINAGRLLESNTSQPFTEGLTGKAGMQEQQCLSIKLY